MGPLKRQGVPLIYLKTKGNTTFKCSLKEEKNSTRYHVPLSSTIKQFCRHMTICLHINMQYIHTKQVARNPNGFIQNRVLWCGHIILKTGYLENIQHLALTQKRRKQLNKSFLKLHHPVFFSCRCRPQSRRRVFPPAASAMTSGVARPWGGFQAKSSQTADTQLKRQQLHRPCLWAHSAAWKLTQSFNIAHATPEYKKKKKTVPKITVLWFI